jgi:cyanophycinase
MPEETATGTLFAIGGHEDREGERLILRAVAEALGGRTLLILATASQRPAAYEEIYCDAFTRLGVQDVRPLALRDRQNAHDSGVVDAIAGCGGVFITGGKQTRLLEAMRGTPAHAEMSRVWREGGVVAGTSAGASALGETAVSGTDVVRLTSGLGYLPRVIVDQHFSQRDRLARLREGIGRAAGHVGIGIDEDTALVIRGDEGTVLGAADVTVVAAGDEPRTFASGQRVTLPSRAPVR